MKIYKKFVCALMCIFVIVIISSCGDSDKNKEKVALPDDNQDIPVLDISTPDDTKENDLSKKNDGDVAENTGVTDSEPADLSKESEEESSEDGSCEEESNEDGSSEEESNEEESNEDASSEDGSSEDGSNEENSEGSSTEITDEGSEAKSNAGNLTGFYKKSIDDELKKRITGISYPGTPGMKITYDSLAYVHVLYVDFYGNTQNGELICDKTLADDMLDIFQQLYAAGYQIDKIKLIDEYGGDDDASCADDNTSCFNYRVATDGSKLSKHAYGRAIDINPYYNPYVTFRNGQPHVLLPATAQYIDRSQNFPHKIDENDLCYKLFTAHGFTWGGYMKTVKDYQHFAK